MVAMNINTNTYALDVTAVSASLTLEDNDINTGNIIVTNNSSIAMFVTTGKTSAPTAVFPTSGNPSQVGIVVLPSTTISFTKTPRDRFISAILESAGTGVLLVKVGGGA